MCNVLGCPVCVVCVCVWNVCGVSVGYVGWSVCWGVQCVLCVVSAWGVGHVVCVEALLLRFPSS